jgi:putative tricarboxylic transport membrane protein
MDAWLLALDLVLNPTVIMTIIGSAMFGLFVGAVPGLTATMATALLVPITFFLPPVAAVGAIVTATAMAIFAGDIPGCLMRIPGTPASAAYVEDSHNMTLKGHAETALGIALVFSAIGGVFGTIVLTFTAPALADVALRFSSFEYFWLVLMGLSCAVFIASDRPLKGLVTLLLGLLCGSVGLENPAAHPRFTFGNPDLLGGLSLIPAMIGLFAVSEVMRFAQFGDSLMVISKQVGKVLSGMGGLMRKYWRQTLRGSVLGTVVGALPGAGADIAAWMSYAMSKKLSKEPEKFGTGHPEGLVESGASNNGALAGAWIPALVFGIPGDSITAIAIGVLYMKDMNPGPTIFVNSPQNVYAVFLLFLIANLIMIPLGILTIKLAANLLKVPRNVLMPIILLFCIVGAFAINNATFDLYVLLGFGLLAWFLEANDFPIAPLILGMLLGTMLEEHFIRSMIKAEGDIMAFVERPIAAGLAIFIALLWGGSAWLALRRSSIARSAARAASA